MSDLEKKILARLTTAEEFNEAWEEGVRSEVFEEPLYEAIWNFCKEYWEKSQAKAVPTAWALKEEFPGYEPTAFPTEETWYLAQLLRRRFTTNKLQTMMMDATEVMHSDPVTALKALHNAAYLAAEVIAPRLTRTNMADTIEERREDYSRLEEYPQGIGVPFGLDLYDLHTGGLFPGELAVIGGYAKTGKTMFGLNAVAQAVRKGYKPLVFSLEMSIKECAKRLDCMFSGVSYNRYIKGHLDIPELAKLHEAQEELRDLGGIQIERPEDEDRTVGALVARARHFGTDFLFIDQLSHVEAGQKTQSLKEHHAVIIKRLKNEISRSGMEIPTLLAAQLRRGDEVITMESFANAAEVEREADILLAISQTRDMRNNGIMGLEILGARRCNNATYNLVWELITQTHIAVESEVR